jgi:hypothetical protein
VDRHNLPHGEEFGPMPKQSFAARSATLLCRCVTLAGTDARPAEPRRLELARGYADRAMALLRQAVARGYKGATHMKNDPDLQPLRGREDFRILAAEVEAARGNK